MAHERDLDVALSAFDDKAKQPTEADLVRVLKGSFVFWNELKERIAPRTLSMVLHGLLGSVVTGND